MAGGNKKNFSKPLGWNKGRPAGCMHTSSDCSTYEGEDFKALGIKAGMSETEVFEKIFCFLREVADAFDLSNYDLSCITDKCPPEDFKEMIRAILLKICKDASPDSPSEPNQNIANRSLGDKIAIAPFFDVKNSTGDKLTHLHPKDYITLIANTLGDAKSIIGTLSKNYKDIKSSVESLSGSLGNEIEVSLPVVTFLKEGHIEPTTLPIDEAVKYALGELEKYRRAIGTDIDIYNAINKTPAGISSDVRLAGSGSMSSISGWVNEQKNLSESFGNLWLAVEDIRSMLKSMKEKNKLSMCGQVDLSMSLTLTGSVLKVFVSGFVPEGAQEKRNLTTFEISDNTGARFSISRSILSVLNTPDGFSIDLSDKPVSISGLIRVVAQPIFYSDVAECEKYVDATVGDKFLMPISELSSTFNAVSYKILWKGYAYDTELKIAIIKDGEEVESRSLGLGKEAELIEGIFEDLDPETAYLVRMRYSTSNGQYYESTNSISTKSIE